MNKIITAACIIVVYCFSACEGTEQDTVTDSTDTGSSTITSAPQNTVNPATPLPVSGQAIKNPLPQPVVNPAALAITVPGMNPPHGQPNHRCDIAVGAPLNSPATKPVTQTVPGTAIPAIQPAAAPAQKTTANIVTLPGMNPPHGQPNHRCDIAVGAPLNSPVIKPSTQTVTPAQVPAPVIVPLKKDSGSK